MTTYHATTVLAPRGTGGMIALDDLTHEDQWPGERRGHPDADRHFWLNEPGVIATVLLTTLSSVVIPATRPA